MAKNLLNFFLSYSHILDISCSTFAFYGHDENVEDLLHSLQGMLLLSVYMMRNEEMEISVPKL